MKIDSYHPPKSSFLSINKDMKLLVDKIITNDRLCKLLYYTDRQALDHPKLTDVQKVSLFEKNIKITPKMYVDNSVLNYIFIKFDNFFTAPTNPEFRENTIEFDIVCHFDQWQMGDFNLRPYRIAAELDTMLHQQRLTGIGLLEFMGAKHININDEFAGVCLMYQTYHRDEDKKPMPNPADQEQFVQDYSDMIEQQLAEGLKIDE